MITIVDYKLGNLGSVQNMLNYLGFESEISSDPEIIKNAEKLILSGVGAFDAGIENLKELGLYDILNDKVCKEKVPILGICLGLQLMSSGSEEGLCKGFSWIEAETVKFKGENLKIPHMMWNTTEICKSGKLFADMYENPKFYFVHSYYVKNNGAPFITALSTYGNDFVSAIEQDNIFGVQFHPEKSHKYGMKILSNFAKL